MLLLIILLEFFVVTFGVWVLNFEVALYAQMPITTLQALFLLSWILLLLLMARSWIRRLRVIGRRELAFARNTLVLGCLVGLLVLVTSRPDADDVGYMHQPLVDASTPGGSFTPYPFYIPFQGEHTVIPFLSENEAWEAMVVVMARLVGIEPLQAYHNAFAFLATIIWVLTYALLFRRFRVPRNRVWLALLATVAFLLLDGNLHRSVGNFTLLRIWQGKIIAWSVLQPAFLLFALRFLACPSHYRFSLLLVTGVVSFFVNRSSIFLFAVLGTAVAFSYLLAYKGNRRRRVRALIPVAAVIPLWFLGAYVALSMLPAESSFFSVFSDIATNAAATTADKPRLAREGGFGGSWWASLNLLVIGGPLTLWRDILFLTVIPFLVVPRPLHRFLPLLSLSVAALALSPLTGPAWFYFSPLVYWRFYYALPLPLCVGLSVHLFSPSTIPRLRPITRFALVVVVVAFTILAVDRPVLSKANDVQLKHPFEYRFRDQPLAFARSVAPRLDGMLVLAPNEISNILSLTEYNSIDLSYKRVGGPAAVTANRVVTRCQVNARTVGGMRQLLNRGVDAVIMSTCPKAALRRLKKLLPDYRFVEEEEAAAFGYRLYRVLPPDL